jgi:hypothetical protein
VNATLGTATATGTITNDDAARPKPGHYHGQIGSGGLVDFDVNADGSAVTGLVINVFETCQPSSGSGIYTLRFGSNAPIGSDLTFDGSGSGTGVTVSLKGKFDTATNVAAGTLQIHFSYDEAGTHYECDSGNSAWGAVWRG